MLGIGIVLILTFAILAILLSCIWKKILLVLAAGLILYLLVLKIMVIVMNYKDALRK